MYQHMMLMCTDFNSKKRIAFHRSYEELLDSVEFEIISNEIKKEFSKVKFSFHHIATEKIRFDSVVEYDKYFEDVVFYSNIDTFKEHIKSSMKITPDDIVKAILTKKEFDKLQLQKILYYVYEEYAKIQDKPLFEENFEVWKYGPAIHDIYNKTSKYDKKEKITFKDKDLEKLKLSLKLSVTDDKDTILQCVDRVIEKYGCYNGGDLINKTHKEGTPWDISKRLNKAYIPFELVKNYARKELV